MKMPCKMYVKRIDVDGEKKWVVGVKQDGAFQYFLNCIFDATPHGKLKAEKAALCRQMVEFQVSIDEVWNEGVEAGHFDAYENREDYLC